LRRGRLADGTWVAFDSAFHTEDAMLHERGAVLTGLGLGAGLMYFLDPERGRRRRALVRDRVAHTARIGEDAIEATGRDVAHRASGATARLRGMRHREPVDDRVLAERVRAKLGRYVSHPRAIDVDAFDGRVTLRGPILKAEVKRLLKKINRIPGVTEVVSQLEEHRDAGNVPALQGGTIAQGAMSGIRPRQWSPTARLLTGTTGMALAGYGASRRNTTGALLAAAGLGLLARAATNLEGRGLTGFRHRSAADAGKASTTDAPVARGADEAGFERSQGSPEPGTRAEPQGEVLR
jgi:hypothetical protein